MTFTIETAKKSDTRARIALCGPAGSGKTFTALQLARGLTENHGRIVLIDTENRSAAKYADGHWKQLALPDFRLETYCAAIEYAQRSADVLIVDSISHAWAGPGGALETADNLQKKARNKMEAWRSITPQHNRFVEALVNCSCHIIVTMRTKTEWVFEQDARGKQLPRKVGTKPVQRDGIEYEFDIVCDITIDHELLVSKTRCPELDGLVVSRPSSELGDSIRRWLNEGESPARLAVLVPVPTEQSASAVPVDDKERKSAALTALAAALGVDRKAAWSSFLGPRLLSDCGKPPHTCGADQVESACEALISERNETLGICMCEVCDALDIDTRAAEAVIVERAKEIGVGLSPQGVRAAAAAILGDARSSPAEELGQDHTTMRSRLGALGRDKERLLEAVATDLASRGIFESVGEAEDAILAEFGPSTPAQFYAAWAQSITEATP